MNARGRDGDRCRTICEVITRCGTRDGFQMPYKVGDFRSRYGIRPGTHFLADTGDGSTGGWSIARNRFGVQFHLAGRCQRGGTGFKFPDSVVDRYRPKDAASTPAASAKGNTPTNAAIVRWWSPFDGESCRCRISQPPNSRSPCAVKRRGSN